MWNVKLSAIKRRQPRSPILGLTVCFGGKAVGFVIVAR
jgi:hypothetical protein